MTKYHWFSSKPRSQWIREQWVSKHLPRWVNHLYTFVVGYFWMRCPECQEYFGGHECGIARAKDPDRGHSCCNRCSPYGPEYFDKEYWKIEDLSSTS